MNDAKGQPEVDAGAAASKGGPTVITLPEPAQSAPGSAGPYRLLQLLGEGGFGAVYLAEQREPIVQSVAVKILKPGMDSREVLARFEVERRALAMMDHPNIARVLDAGQTDSGRPYFVMELVRGVPITTYCDDCQLSVKERLVLFMLVCHAVQHAHQKGVVHRDLKPSNVMVTMLDGKPVPKVIDFGVAKAVDQRLTDHTYCTRLHQFIGTPEYMSPEQADLSGLDIDTRSDIYSLGALLHELLIGITPLTPEELYSRGFSGMQQVIREHEPLRPSVRVTRLAQDSRTDGGDDDDDRFTARTPSIKEAARRRQTDAPGLARVLRGDLDWIVARCLEKDRTRRYESADALAMDVLRYLCDEPVTASPPTFRYRLVKLLRRNRGLAAWVALAITLTLGAALVTGWIAASQTARLFDAHRQREAAQNRYATALVNIAGTLDVAAWNPAILDGLDDLVNRSHAARDALAAQQACALALQARHARWRGDSAAAREKLTLAIAKFERAQRSGQVPSLPPVDMRQQAGSPGSVDLWLDESRRELRALLGDDATTSPP